MKKQTLLKSTLCLLMALVCNVAWAAVTLPKVSTGSEMHYYRIKSLRTGKYAAYTGDYSQLAQTSEQDGLTFSNIWYVTADGENYKLHNVSTDFVYAGVSSFTSTGATTYIKENPYRAGYVCVSITENLLSNCWDDQGSGAKIGNYNPRQNDNEGTSWTFEEVTEGISYHTCSFTLNEPTIGESYTGSYTCVTYNNEKSLPLCVTKMGATLTNIAWGESTLTADIAFPFPVSKEGKTQSVIISAYKGANVNIGHVKYYVDGSNVKAQPSSVTDGNDEWEIYPSFADGVFTFIIKNVGTGKYIATNATSATHDDGTVTVVEGKENATSFTLAEGNRFRLPTEADLFLSAGGSNSTGQNIGAFGYIGNNGGIHNGVSNCIYFSNLPYEITDELGGKYEGTFDATAGNSSSWLSSPGLTISNPTLSEDGSKFTASIDFAIPVSKKDGVTNSTFIANWGASDNPKKWFPVLEDGIYNVKVYNKANSTSIALSDFDKWRWAIYPQCVDGKFTYLIKNIHTGTYVYADPAKDANAGSEKGRITLKETGTAFTLVANGNQINLAYINNNEVTLKLTTNGSGDNNVYLGSYEGTHSGNHILFSTPYYTITTDANGYATIYTPAAVTIPNGVTAYTGHLNATNSSLFLNEVSGATIPAQTAVVLKGTASTTYVFSAADGDLDAIANNDLKGASEVIDVADVEGGVYTFSDNAFTKVAEGYIEGYTAYFELPEGSKTTITLNEVGSVEDFVNGDVYTFVTPRGWIGGDDENDKVIGTVKPGVTVNPAASSENSYFQWVVYKSNNGNYYLYNLGKEKFLALQSNNIISFVENPTSKALTFKSSSSAEYPIMISPDNKGTVSQNANAGLFYWNSGLSNPGDEGNTHKVTKVKTLTIEELATIADLVNAYDRRLYVTAEVTGSWDNNPNTHFGDITATSSAGTLTTRLKTTPSVATVDYDGLNETTIGFTRDYRGYEFQGYSFNGVDLGKSFTLTEEQKASITEENPLVAKFRATEDVTLFYDDDVKSYRIPAIGKTSTGRLIAVSDYRHNLDDIGMDRGGTGSHRIDLVIRTSDNNGKTWSPKQTIAEGTDNRGADDCAFGDAAIAVVGQKVLVMAAAGDVIFADGTADAHNRTWRVYSEDNGVTWAKEDISTKLFIGANAIIPNGYTAFFGSGKLAVDENFNGTGNARIYGAMLIKNASGTYNNFVIYTDNFGADWKILGGSTSPIAHQDEPKVEILPSGQILFSVRRGGGRQFNVFTYGTGENDKANGVGTWNGNVDGCDNEGSNSTNGEIYCIDAKNASGDDVKLLLQSQPVGGGTWDRENVSIWYKEITDAAYTSAEIAAGWTKGIQVSHQLSAYSTMVLQNDGRIAFFFEEAPCYNDNYVRGYCMVYTPLTIEQITKNKYFSLDFDFDTEREFSVVLTDAQGNEYRDQVTSSFGGIATALTTKYPFITMGDTPNLESDGENFTYTNTVTLPFKVSNAETTVWHNIYWPSNTGAAYPIYLSASASGDTYVGKVTEQQAYGNSSSNTAANAAKIGWAVYNVGNSFTFKFKNQLTGKFIQVSSVADGDNQNVKYVAEAEAEATAFELVPDAASYNGDYALKAVIGGTTGYLCSTSAGYGYATHYKGTGHQGAWLKFVEAPDFETLFAEVNAVLNMFGNGLGQYSNISEENLAAVTAAKTAMENAGSVKLNTLKEYKNYTSKTEGGTLNLPQSGQFFRIRGISGNYIDASSIYNNTGQMSMKSAETCNYNGTIFYLDKEKHLLNYATGTYARQTREIGSVGDSDKGVWAFTESTRTGKGKYLLQCTVGNTSNGQHLHDSDGNRADRCSRNCGERHDFTLEEVTDLPFTFKKAALGFATFNAPEAVELPEGVLAYITEVDKTNNVLQMYRLEGNVVPANTPVMLYNEAAKAVDAADETTIDLVIVDAYTGDEFGEINNDFYGTIAAETYPVSNTGETVTVYSLQKKQKEQDSDPDMVGFYKKASDTTLGGFKAWIMITEKQGAQGRAFTIIFDGDDATGLKEALGLENENVEIYDLSGRRLDKPAKGVNVIGGKLVIK